MFGLAIAKALKFSVSAMVCLLSVVIMFVGETKYLEVDCVSRGVGHATVTTALTVPLFVPDTVDLPCESIKGNVLGSKFRKLPEETPLLHE